MSNLVGDFISGLGYATSGIVGRPVQIIPGGLGQSISGTQNSQNYNPYGPAFAAGPVNSGQVLGATQRTSPSGPYGPFLPSSGGSAGGGGGGTPTNNNPQPSGPSESDLINSEYNNRIGDLNNQAGTLQSDYGSIQGDINSQYGTSTGTLKSNFDQSNAGLDLSATQGQQRQQDALTAARRLYNDLIQGGQQRFGGASSAGEAYSALTGRQLQQNNQAIGSQFNDFMNQVNLAKTTIKSKYDDSVAQLEQQKNSALNQAQRDFQDKMSQINSLKSQAGSDKAAQQLSALQNLRNQIYNINLQTGQNSQTLTQLRQQAEDQLSQYTTAQTQSLGQANNAQVGFNTNTTTNPTNTLAFGGGGAVGPQAQTGQIAQTQSNPKDWYDQQVFA